MKWIILYALERTEEVQEDNINKVAKIANQNKREGEKIVRIGLTRMKEEKLWFDMSEEEWKKERERIRKTVEAHFKK